MWAGAALFGASLCWFLYCYLALWGLPADDASSWTAIAADTALFSAFALHHSLFARTRLKTRVQRLVQPHLERSVYTWTASVLFIAVCGFWQPVDGILYRFPGIWALPGYATQAAGILLTIRSAAVVDALELAGVRAVQRGRDPARLAGTRLQTHGLYGFVRHPLYFAWLLMVFGTPVMTGTRAAFAILSTVYLMIAIPFEERGLIDTFGAEYVAYRQRVRWRMVPGLY